LGALRPHRLWTARPARSPAPPPALPTPRRVGHPSGATRGGQYDAFGFVLERHGTWKLGGRGASQRGTGAASPRCAPRPGRPPRSAGRRTVGCPETRPTTGGTGR
jgi:hypothetical protein